MHIRILAVGSRPPAWIAAGVEEFRRRLPATFRLTLEELAPGRRSGAAVRAAVEDEGRRLLEALAPREYAVALEERGREYTTLAFAEWLRERMREGRDLAFLIGGPDGLSDAVLARCELRFALSRLTFPHALVRVILLEQIYRAHSVLGGHPYHRE
jgi:23S rRNA (pseudouridine1915-N3)-methyltransferase